MAKGKKKTKIRDEKPEYVARESLWFTLGSCWWLIILILSGLGLFAFLHFVYLPTATSDLTDILSIVSWVALAVAVICMISLFFKAAGRPTFEFYSNRVVEKAGLFNKIKQSGVFIGIYTVSVAQDGWGQFFHYGDLIVDYPGYWDLKTRNLANPERLERYLLRRMTGHGLHARISNTSPVRDLQLY